ncbi:alpha-E domain-containing protein [Nostoc ellipsosporum NOK]|nr:alpha-E domain-containing protein [Nostoc ellipsosporum NOK]
MLSRIADSLFWLNRYMERSDCLTRIIRTSYILSFDASEQADFTWRDVLQLCSASQDEEVLELGRQMEPALEYLICNTANINSIRVLVSRARENARGVQDNITKEVWEEINQLYHIVNAPTVSQQITGLRALEIIDRLDQCNTLYYGVADNTMPRGQGWNFMNLGKFIERCILTIDNSLAHFGKMQFELPAAKDILFWRHLLLSLSGYELYLKKYTRGQHNLNVIDHILFNQDFPRSLIYSLSRIRRYLDFIIDDTQMEGSERLQKNFGRICSKVEFADMNTIQETGIQGFLYPLRQDLVEFSNQLTRIYFSYA